MSDWNPETFVFGESVKHVSAGAFLTRDGKDGDEVLLIERATPPLGWAGPAGHVDRGELPEVAVLREVFEETGLTLVGNIRLVLVRYVPWNECGDGDERVGDSQGHLWYLFEGDVEGDPRPQPGEVRRIEWVPVRGLEHRELEPVWRLWFRELGLVPSA